MSGHNGYGATRSGSKLSLSTSWHLPALSPDDARVIAFAGELGEISAALEMTASDTLAMMRRDGIIDCNDEAATAILALAASETGAE